MVAHITTGYPCPNLCPNLRPILSNLCGSALMAETDLKLPYKCLAIQTNSQNSDGTSLAAHTNHETPCIRKMLTISPADQPRHNPTW